MASLLQRVTLAGRLPRHLSQALLLKVLLGLTLLALAGVLLLWDLYPVLLAQHELDRLATLHRDDVKRDQQALLEQLSGTSKRCPHAPVLSPAWRECLVRLSPTLTTVEGQYAVLRYSAVWLSLHPEDTALRALAARTLEQAWATKGRTVDVLDTAGARVTRAQQRSLGYRLVYGVGMPLPLADTWARQLEDVEVELANPALARRRNERRAQVGQTGQPTLPTLLTHS